MSLFSSISPLIDLSRLSAPQQKKLHATLSKEWPSSKSEFWHYAPLRDLNKLSLIQALSQPSLTLEDYAQQALCFVFVNGQLQQEPQSLPEGVTLSDQEPLSQHSYKDQPFAKISTLSHPKIWTISIADNVVLTNPIRFIHLLSNAQLETAWSQTALQVSQGKHSQAIIEEEFSSLDNHACFLNHSQHFTLQTSSQLTYLRHQKLNTQSYLLSFSDMDLARDSQGFSYIQNTGARYSRHTLEVNLNQENAHMKALGNYALTGQQHCENYTQINHVAGHTESEQTYKGILADSSTATFHGGVHVYPNARLSSSKQLNQNILLSSKALVNTKPQLEIDNDDVQCTHGATIGQLNPEEYFYLESRGIPPQQAQHMLFKGFVFDLLEQTSLSQDKQQQWLKALLQPFESLPL